MITINLLPHGEKVAVHNPHPTLRHSPLHHQLRTVEALRQFDVVMNTYNTGTGKTIASLLHLFEIDGQNKNVLFIAPTNALLMQHAEDIEEFVRGNRLNFVVRRVTAQTVRELDPETRSGKTLHHLIRNYLQFEDDDVTERKPLILVVNPDIFYYAMFAQYGQNDRRNLLHEFIIKFDYIVIDEFHYYDSKQLANFLFVFTLFDQLGYFSERARKVCLLSATPTPHVKQYLHALFPARWTLIAPENESAESTSLPTIPSLAPLTLTLADEVLTDWIMREGQTLKGWVATGQDGAIISSSLGRVNQAHALARPLFDAEMMANNRITGPESAESRRTATFRPLIFASPTVDIGYNFKKQNKDRQNVDFLICDARYQDGLLQRIGRTGRVLGKPITDQPSHAIAFLPTAALETLHHLDGQTLDRATFNAHIAACETLPIKHSLTRYIDTYSIIECFYPLYEIGQTLPADLHIQLETLFERLKRTFAPSSNRTYQKMRGFYHAYKYRRRWYYEDAKSTIPHSKETAKQVSDWLRWLDLDKSGIEEIYPLSHIRQMLPDILGEATQRNALKQFVKSQLTITEALFNFRDSFQASQAVVYDPQHLLSSNDYNQYDLFHLLRRYEMRPFTVRQLHEGCELSADFYFELRAFREPKLILQYRYVTDLNEDDFRAKWCHRPIGIHDLKLQAREIGEVAPKAGLLSSDLIDAIAAQTIVALIVAPEHAGVAINVLKQSNIWSQKLTVNFGGFSANSDYIIFLGKDAYFAYAELPKYWQFKTTFDAPAIII